jgi:hypothetical protein
LPLKIPVLKNTIDTKNGGFIILIITYPKMGSESICGSAKESWAKKIRWSRQKVLDPGLKIR